jgi:hypothetical protein
VKYREHPYFLDRSDCGKYWQLQEGGVRGCISCLGGRLRAASMYQSEVVADLRQETVRGTDCQDWYGRVKARLSTAQRKRERRGDPAIEAAA